MKTDQCSTQSVVTVGRRRKSPSSHLVTVRYTAATVLLSIDQKAKVAQEPAQGLDLANGTM